MCDGIPPLSSDLQPTVFRDEPKPEERKHRRVRFSRLPPSAAKHTNAMHRQSTSSLGKGTCKTHETLPSGERAGTQGQGRGITQVAAQRNLGKPLTARGAEPLSKPVSQWKAPVPARRIRGRGAPKDWSGWNGRNLWQAGAGHGLELPKNEGRSKPMICEARCLDSLGNVLKQIVSLCR